MKHRIILLATLAVACAESVTESKSDGGEVERYGAPLADGAPLASFAEVLANPEAHADKTVRVEGVVRKVCQAKGCWMELASDGSADAAGARITFKDYGFFVPTDSMGSRARVEGRLEVTTMSPEQVDHMESEGASVPSKTVDGGAREVRLVATGVELYRKG